MKFFGVGESDSEQRLGRDDRRATTTRELGSIGQIRPTISLRISGDGKSLLARQKCDEMIALTRTREFLTRVGDPAFSGDGESFENNITLHRLCTTLLI